MDTSRPSLFVRVLSVILIAGVAACGGDSASLVAIHISPSKPEILKGATQQFAATGTYSDHSVRNVTDLVVWSSSSPAAATVANAAGSAGLATGAGVGTTTIAGTLGNVSGSTTLTVLQRSEVVYVGGEFSIYQYQITADGGLVALNPATVPGVINVTVDSSGEYAYGTGVVYPDPVYALLQFTLGPSGVLIPMLPASVPAGLPQDGALPGGVVLHPSGKFAYTETAGEYGAGDCGIEVFTIGAGGKLQTPWVSSLAPSCPGPPAFTPNGAFAYVVDAGGPPYLLTQWAVAADGTFNPLSPNIVPTSLSVYSLLVHPNGKFLYTVASLANGTQFVVGQFSIGTDGLLTPLTPASVAIPPGAMVIHPSGRYAYVASGSSSVCSNSVSEFSITDLGTLVALNPAAVANPDACAQPAGIAVDPNGDYLYVTNNSFSGTVNVVDSETVSEYAIASDGVLSPIGEIDIGNQSNGSGLGGSITITK